MNSLNSLLPNELVSMDTNALYSVVGLSESITFVSSDDVNSLGLSRVESNNLML